MTDDNKAQVLPKETIDRFNELCTSLTAHVEGDADALAAVEGIIVKAKRLLVEGPAGIPATLSALVMVLRSLGDTRASFLFEVINNGLAALSTTPVAMLRVDTPPPRDGDDKTQGTAEDPQQPPSAG